jgi:hypothetical protein
MAEAALIEARNSSLEELEAQAAAFLSAFAACLRQREARPLLAEIERALTWTEDRGDDAHLWQAATGILPQKLNTLLALAPAADPAFATSLLDRARLEISDKIQRQTTRSMLGHMDMSLGEPGLRGAEAGRLRSHLRGVQPPAGAGHPV